MKFARVRTAEQWQEAVKSGAADAVIVDYACPALHMKAGALGKETIPVKGAAGKLIYLQLPDVLREDVRESICRLLAFAEQLDGVVVKNPDELGLLKEQGFGGDVIGDAFLYGYNPEAMAFCREHFPKMKFLLSDELSDAELEELARKVRQMNIPRDDLIYKAYGHQPLMITAQCMVRNYGNCPKAVRGAKGASGQAVEFKDEKGRKFLAVNECSQCYTTIYSAEPVSMLDRLAELPWQNVLVDLTVEDAQEARRLLTGGAAPAQAGRGHHYKGID